MAGMEELLCGEDMHSSFYDLGENDIVGRMQRGDDVRCSLRRRRSRSNRRVAVEFEFAKFGGSSVAELPCKLHADEFKLRSFACNKRNEWHDMERSIVRWPRGR